MIKVGMNLLLWSDNTNFREHASLLEYVREVGFDSVEFNVGIVSDERECARFGEAAARLGLDVTTVGTFAPEVCNPVSPDAVLREAVYPEFKKFVDLTVAFGSPLICGPLYQALGYFTGARPTEQEWAWSIDTMKPCFEYAAKKGVTVAVEPLNRFEAFLLNTVEDGVRYVEELNLGNVGLLVDTMHSNIEELHVADAYRGALPAIRHVHISENNRGIPGTGHACGQDVFDVFLEGGYDGRLTIEAFNLGAPSLTGALHLWRSFAASDDLLAKEGHDYIRSCLHRRSHP